jgi:hypothetical protein
MLPQEDWDKLYELWEGTDKMLEDQRYPDQADFKNVERQMGKAMRPADLIKKITKLNPKLVSQDTKAVPGNAAFYYVQPDKSLRYTNASHTILGLVPEFTIMHTDAADLPAYYPTYGWRTVVCRLLKGKYLSWAQVLKTFGDVPTNDSRAYHWNLNVANFRV